MNALALRRFASSLPIEIADPLQLYYNRCTRGLIQRDNDQLRALFGIKKVHQELLDYQPPIPLLTLLESLRSSSDPASKSSSPPPAWPFQRSPSSALPQGLTSEEQSQRDKILGLTEKARSKELVRVLQNEASLEELTTPRGFLLTGPPGTGKSMLLDLFMDSLPVSAKSRFHYHHFLLSMYTKINEALELQRAVFEAEERAMNEGLEDGVSWSRREEMKKQALTKGWRSVFAGGRSPSDLHLNVQEFVLVGIARDLIKECGWILAFDEIQLVDIAGAGLINRVLSWYWRLGGVVVGTSNRLPQDLYNSGVQRESISSFLIALASRSPVIELRSPLDYRRQQRQSLDLTSIADLPPGDFGSVEAWKRWGSKAQGWFIKSGAGDEEFRQAVERLVGSAEGDTGRELKVYGRNIKIPWALDGVAKFSFHDLCEQPLGAADFITIASNYHTIILTEVPVLLLSAKNEARRFITLLDALYETKTRILVLADVHVDNLFFPDAIATTSTSDATLTKPSLNLLSADGIDEGASSNSSAHLRDAVDPAGEIGDSLVEEFLSEVQLDLEAPYRPNISSYDQSAGEAMYEADEARVERAVVRSKKNSKSESARPEPHPSASTPSFQSLAIFTGEEERFAFARAVSRVHEMTSQEYLRTAEWTPLKDTLRTWERPRKSVTVDVPLSTTASSTVEEIEDGTPESRSSREGPPLIKNDHIWGVREDWGKGAGEWGKGVKGKRPTHEKE